MQLKYKIVIAVSAILVSFAVGRYTAPLFVKTSLTDSKEKDKSVEVSKNVRKETIVTETTKPDGTKTVTTKVVDDVKTKKDTDTKVVTSKTETKDIQYKDNTLSLSFLGGVSLLHPEQGFIFGGSINKTVIGPASIGLWGLSNGTGGVSVGVTF